MKIQHYDQIEPAARELLDILAKNTGKPIYELTPAEARSVLEAASQAQPLQGESESVIVESREYLIPNESHGQIKLHIIKPQGVDSKLPILLYIHGGGWVLGSLNTHRSLVEQLAAKAKVAVVFVDYDRSPEAKFPVAIEQAYAALVYMHDHAEEFNFDANKIAVAGDSVGGNMTAAVTILAKERGGPKISRQILFYPVTNANFETNSYKQFAEGYFLTLKAMQWFWDCYLPDAQLRHKSIASPLEASIDSLKDLPTALITTNEFDVLRDEAEAYATHLANAGVEVTAVRMLGTIHDNLILGAIKNTPAPKATISLAVNFLNAAFAEN